MVLAYQTAQTKIYEPLGKRKLKKEERRTDVVLLQSELELYLEHIKCYK